VVEGDDDDVDEDPTVTAPVDAREIDADVARSRALDADVGEMQDVD
jgi:hypothetical protein